ncbi:MAG: hypothetical protein NTU53_06435 [Planctomycetota bacterium]|nr:hypothetical protein [Planctomycetota bacterium]
MKRMILCAALMAVCALLLQPTATSAKDKVTRPFKARSDLITVRYDPYPTVAVLEGSGWATHLGNFTADGDLVGTTGGHLIFRGAYTSANGDKLFYDALVDLGAGYTVAFTGGTGRFENASGGYEAVYTYREMDTSGFPVVIVKFGAEGSGTITY